MSVIRPLGCETEYGIIAQGMGKDPVHWSAQLLRDFAAHSEVALAHWDYLSESPLRDLRGFTITKQEADASQITDDPYHFAPSGPGRPGFVRDCSHEPQTNDFLTFTPQVTTFVLPNGGRFYVDHAHPEYSTPECLGPWAGMIADHLADKVALRALSSSTYPMALYRNNTDGKGASYGHHENYLLSRSVDFSALTQCLIPFFLTRIIVCGAGRVGWGQTGTETTSEAGFQISARADYLESVLGLQTTFNRPIINTRDEPHADAQLWRRLHVIVGDANRYPAATFLKLGITSLLLSLAEAAYQPEHSLEMANIWQELGGLNFVDNPVRIAQEISRDLFFQKKYRLGNGKTLTALEIQKCFYQLCKRGIKQLLDEKNPLVFAKHGSSLSPPEELIDSTAEELINAGTDWETAVVMSVWKKILDSLSQREKSSAHDYLLGHCEWYGKYYLAEETRKRYQSDWRDIRLQALDLQWSKILSPAVSSLPVSLRKSVHQQDSLTGDITGDYELEDIDYLGTRAYWRGKIVQEYSRGHDAAFELKTPVLKRASWTSLIFELSPGEEIRADLGDLELEADYGTKVEKILDKHLSTNLRK